MTKEAHVYCRHIHDAIRRIRDYTADGREAFLQDEKTQDAVIRNLEIIGEAVKKLPPDMTRRHNDIPWKSIAGMRDRLIHHYFGVDLELVWKTLENRLDELTAVVRRELQQQTE